MKINYRTHPILERINHDDLANIRIHNLDVAFLNRSTILQTLWRVGINEFRKNIFAVSNPFFIAANQAWGKLMPLYRDIIENRLTDIEIKGIYIIGKEVFLIDYSYNSKIGKYYMNFIVFNEMIPVGFYFENQKETKDSLISWLSKGIEIVDNGDRETEISRLMCLIVILHLFKSYAQVETKILASQSKIKDINCKYINETKLSITYLDSKWFTTLVKSDGFKVRGHFRLQPKKKEGKWTHELIYIDEFMKTGYTAPARKLNSLN